MNESSHYAGRESTVVGDVAALVAATGFLALVGFLLASALTGGLS